MRRQSGFTFTELVVTLGVFAIIAAMSIPMLLTGLAGQRFAASARAVQSELQNARLLAVSTNRPMRVRFNCPAAGQYRRLELIGTPSAPDARDTASNRCDPALYPMVPADANPMSRPNHDGAVRTLSQGVTFSASQTIEFWPNGTAHAPSGTAVPWPTITAVGIAITLSDGTSTKSITVNGVGKVQIR